MTLHDEVLMHQDEISELADRGIKEFGEKLLTAPRNDKSPMWTMTYGLPNICRVVAIQVAINKLEGI